MKNNKITRSAFFAALILLLSLLLVISSFASDAALPVEETTSEIPDRSTGAQYVFDDAGILSESEKIQLEATLASVSKRTGIDVAFATASENISTSALVDYADIYAENHLSSNNVLLMVNFPSGTDGRRDWQISTEGKGITILTDYGIDCIFDDMQATVSAGYGSNYPKLVSAFASKVGSYYDYYVNSGEPFDNYEDNQEESKPNFLQKGIIAAIVGFFASMIRSGGAKGQLKSVFAQSGADNYEKTDSLNVTTAAEYFLYSTVSKTRRQTESSSSPRSGGGGSSTHHSSSGRTHGGGGRSF